MSTIYIVSNNGKLTKKGETLQLINYDGTTTILFPYKIEQLIIMGSVEITSGALKLLMKNNLDTVFLGKNGRFNGKLVFQESKNVFLRKKQFQYLNDNDFRLKFAKAIVNGKLKNQLSFMQRIKRKRDVNEKILKNIDGIKRVLKSVPEAKSVDVLRGYEGVGAKYFFNVFRYNIIQDWAVFKGRSMHPPKDNVNAVLSFLYTLIFFRIDGLLESEGLDSYAGFFHELNYGKRTLAFDLMEEYRTPLGDTLCCSLFNLGVLGENDFESVVFSPDNMDYPLQNTDVKDEGEIDSYETRTGVLLTKDGLRKVIAQFERKLETEIYYEPLNKHISYRRAIAEQIKHFKRVLMSEENIYKPLVIR